MTVNCLALTPFKPSLMQDLEASELAENQILTHVEAAPIEAVKQGLSRSNKKKCHNRCRFERGQFIAGANRHSAEVRA
jgi:hypothetical protein